MRIAIPDVLHRDVRRTLARVFSRPSRVRKLVALGPRGWLATARFVARRDPARRARAGRDPHARASASPIRRCANEALASIDGKAYHVQGGAILATFIPGAAARRYVAIVAALETIYDYLDNLCDRLPGVSQRAYATLHGALIDALDDRRVPADYYRDGPPGDDGGYLRSLVEDVRDGLRALPHYAAVRERLVEVARLLRRAAGASSTVRPARASAPATPGTFAIASVSRGSRGGSSPRPAARRSRCSR